MGEYSREQASQLSRTIANSGTGSRQLKGLVNNSLLSNKHKLVNSSLKINKVSQLVHASFLPANYGNANAFVLPAGVGGVAAGIAAAAGHLGVFPSDILRASLTMPVVPAAILHGPGAGVPDSSIDFFNHIPNQAHHIVEVAGGGRGGNDARALLTAAGIDINSSCNGVLLPSVHHRDAGNATVHLGNHMNEYMTCVNASLSRAINAAIPAARTPAPGAIWPAAATNAYVRAHPGPLGGLRAVWLQGIIVARLNAIRTMLLTGNVPINVGVDGDWDPLTNAPITITRVFANFGL